MALAAARGAGVTVLCLSYGERGESAKAWREGRQLEEIKALRRQEASQAAAALGAAIEFADAGDYPLRESDDLIDSIVRTYRRVQPAVVLTHALADPYNYDHPAAARMALQARVLAQAIGYDAPGEPAGAPPVFLFEPHQPEQCDFRPQVLLDITTVFDVKRKAMECMNAQEHMWDYYTDLARRRGVQLQRNAGPNLGLALDHGRGLYAAVPAGDRDAVVRNVVVTGCPGADRASSTSWRTSASPPCTRRIGRTGYLGPGIRPIQQGTRIGGTAVTVVCWPGDNLMIHAAVEQCQAGDILVVTTTSPCTDGAFGELLATSLPHRGVRGLSSGGVRDTAELRAMGFPAVAGHVSAQGTVKATPGAVNVPVTHRRPAIRAGDAILADDDGVCSVPAWDVAGR